jgi:uncharacterized protein involved in exopolysaccharide biosynthesis
MMENKPQELDIRRYLQIVYKKRYLAIAVAAAITTLIIVAIYVRTPSYEVSSRVSVEKNYLDVLMKDISIASSMIDVPVQALTAVMLSRSMLLQVMSDLEIDVKSKGEAEIERLIKHYQKSTKINVEMNRSSRQIFTVTYRNRNPRFARDYVNALINRYIIDSLSSKRQDAAGANRFVIEQIALYRNKINRIEAELARSPKERGIQKLPDRLSSLQKKYDDLLEQYTEQHPEVVRLRSEIESIRGQLQQDRMSGKEDENGQGGASGDVKKSRAEKDGNRKSIADLERDRETYKKIYESLAASIGRSEVTTQVDVKAKADTFHILDPAVLPIEPAGPARWMLILLGIFAGIAGGVGIPIVLDMQDHSIKNLGMLKDFGIPVIGMIPNIQNAAVIITVRKKDRLVYSAAGLYLTVVMVLLVVEFLK